MINHNELLILKIIERFNLSYDIVKIASGKFNILNCSDYLYILSSSGYIKVTLDFNNKYELTEKAMDVLGQNNSQQIEYLYATFNNEIQKKYLDIFFDNGARPPRDLR